MHCGVPAVASSIPAHREVGGKAVVYVEHPLSCAEWANALAAVISDPDLSGSLSRKGRDRAGGMTWDGVADHMIALARHVVAVSG